MHALDRSARLTMAFIGVALLCAAQAASPTFKILISSERAAVPAGTELKVKVVLTNTSDHRIVLRIDKGAAAELADYRILVRDSQGRIQRISRYYWSVGQMGIAGVPEGSERDYSDDHGEGPGTFSFGYTNPGPGETNEMWFDVNKLYAPLPPGTYTIQAQRTDEETKLLVKSNILTLDITE